MTGNSRGMPSSGKASSVATDRFVQAAAAPQGIEKHGQPRGHAAPCPPARRCTTASALAKKPRRGGTAGGGRLGSGCARLWLGHVSRRSQRNFVHCYFLISVSRWRLLGSRHGAADGSRRAELPKSLVVGRAAGTLRAGGTRSWRRRERQADAYECVRTASEIIALPCAQRQALWLGPPSTVSVDRGAGRRLVSAAG